MGIVEVGCTLSDPRVLARVSNGIALEGGHACCLGRGQVLEATGGTRVAALVYDMAPEEGCALDFVKDVSAVRPDWPIWLYHAPCAALMEQVADLACLRNVWASSQAGGPLHDAEVRMHVRRLLTSVPRVRLLHLLDSVLRPLPGEVRDFLEISLAQRDHAGPRAFRVRNGAANLPSKLRQLERLCHAASVPGPKRLLDHVMLVFATFKTVACDVPLPRAAGQAGLSLKALDDLRHRVLGPHTRWAELEPRARFEFALMALAKACDAPQQAAAEILRLVIHHHVA